MIAISPHINCLPPYRRHNTAFTLIELFIVVAILFISAAIIIPRVAEAKRQAHGRACGVNLQLIEAAKASYLRDNPNATTVTNADLLPYLGCAEIPECPAGGTYSNVNSLYTRVTCSLNGDPIHDAVTHAEMEGAASPAEAANNNGRHDLRLGVPVD